MWPQLLIAAAIAAAAATSSWWLTSDHYEGVMAKEKLAAKAELDKANLKADNAAIDWQAWAEAQPAKIVYRNRKAADVYKAEPVWSAASVPVSVQQLLTTPSPGSDSVVPDFAMPAASAASAASEPGSGSSVSRAAGFFHRLFQTPPRTGGSTTETREP